ncbi:hypothetical protein [Paenibacillus sedimenti]|uniref:Uncharacterized protein n=1 Tax=Paenibacillus sedimenti TaxID=2770274 RepID=A0A926KQQ8_9BACL|nr:hypothetical protein [Paenibacillus sedimenti]MBD0380330.1 hypothetical protein [Paenibacillus sedimenti]
MSMKSIDLQFAVHKNDEAGLKQNQLMQKPRQDETILENQAAQTTELDRGRSSKLEESARTNIKDHSRKNQKQRERKRENKANLDSAATSGSSNHYPDHPYKGHHIDLSL